MSIQIPIYVMGSYDSATHKTEADIAYLVRHELDLFEEGEDSDLTPATARRARRWLAGYEARQSRKAA